MVGKVKATLFISEEKREKIRNSGLSLEEYFDRLYEMHERFSMDKWNDGYFSLGYFRVCLLRAETLNLLLTHFGDKDLYKVGREVGEQLRSTITNGFNHYIQLDDESKKEMISNLNRFSGWGHFNLENETIIITMPFFTKPFFIQGYIEGLLNVKLAIIESYPDRMAFKIAP